MDKKLTQLEAMAEEYVNAPCANPIPPDQVEYEAFLAGARAMQFLAADALQSFSDCCNGVTGTLASDAVLTLGDELVKATPSPWHSQLDSDGDGYQVVAFEKLFAIVPHHTLRAINHEESDAGLIAACHPQAVIQELDQLDAAESECAAQTEVIQGAPWYKDIEILQAENARLRSALELIAAPKRADGTYNRCRDACEKIARTALGEG